MYILPFCFQCTYGFFISRRFQALEAHPKLWGRWKEKGDGGVMHGRTGRLNIAAFFSLFLVMIFQNIRDTPHLLFRLLQRNYCVPYRLCMVAIGTGILACV